jgi:hypothetical protein
METRSATVARMGREIDRLRSILSDLKHEHVDGHTGGENCTRCRGEQALKDWSPMRRTPEETNG